MAFALVIIGLCMVITSLRGTEHEFATQLGKDFSGNDNFLYWLAALGIIGSVGYLPKMKRFSDTFIVLLLLSFALSNTGIWSKLTSVLQSPPTPAAPVNVALGAASGGASGGASSSSASSGGGLEGAAMGAASGAAMGAVAGPMGMAAGAVIGGIMGGIG
jgi:hypothetical protein